ncbi:AarF/ABC1/UbiB kinase family protein [Paeniglutamicibacter psychrophenolicus]|uniref:Unusual protein kinase regulating ubiquinone biosynthesis (AarF/ABC1/UbiB family) n=1 Tax=Paeniglutamicibacter psychrophenolicus TaxID=257454 RepID=A0ABS4WHJ7_9MICC|nr:putative unusual protein kinase regulating ubiquinone biosynthesis (AarF/ABC1/UbiB family) [Paeniglutamicibacter psychrophenolicus]
MSPVPAGPGNPGAGTGNTRARYRRILRFAARHLLTIWFHELFLHRIGLSRISERTRAKRKRDFARRFHALALELGGLMIKVGQFMSSRLDVLPPEITEELEGLQDEVPAVPFDAIRALAEQELGAPLGQRFAWIEQTPIAAASLGQAHRARLLPADAADTGLDTVVVKVQRPGIEEIVAADLAALRKVGGWLSHFRVVSKRVDMPALVAEFAQTSLQEIDYLHEAANAERFAADFADDSRVAVPAVVWERTTRRVLTLQDVTAFKITDSRALAAAGIDPVLVAPVFAEVMFDQLFTNGYFHADPHPGNIFITPAPDASGGHPWKVTFIDFGMMGEVPTGTRSGLRKLLIAAAARDGKGLVEAISQVGVLLPSADTSELERAMTQLFSRFGGMGFAELREVDPREFRGFADEFGQTIRTLPFQLPEDFLLIIRAISLTSGACSSLDPGFNLWDSVEPYAAQLLREERGNLASDVANQALEIAVIALGLPGRLDRLAARIEDGSLSVANPRFERRVARLERTGRRAVHAVLFGALLIAGAILRPDDEVLGNVLMIGSVLPLLRGWWTGHRSV